MLSELIEEYVKQKSFDKACKTADTIILKYARNPRSSSLKTLWNGLIEAKEFEKLRLHDKSLRAVSNRLTIYLFFFNCQFEPLSN